MQDVPLCRLSHDRREQLAAEIGRLSSYLYAAEHRLLTLLREFDAGRGWEGLGFPMLTPVSRAVRRASAAIQRVPNTTAGT